MTIFARNLEIANERNKENILAGGESVHGITMFMDLTPEEFKATYLMPNYKPMDIERGAPEPVKELAGSKDWRTAKAVTAVKDQGRCGSCWAFSATEAIESYYMLKGNNGNSTGTLMNLSAQQITSCDKNDGGCNGGFTETAYEYVHKAGGIETEANYPYTSTTGKTGTCKFDSSKVAVKVAGYKGVSAGESNLKTALNSGPASICLAADAFQTYTGGILKKCTTQVDHCVQAVGYDDTSSPPYWIVRNSWSTGWGEKGYIRIAQGSDLCKISSDITYPTF
jgi:C1A family cysteine protease